jgi:hypothetical protein
MSRRGRRQRRSYDDSEGVVRDIGFGKRCEDSTNLEEIKTERKEGGKNSWLCHNKRERKKVINRAESK